MKFVLPLLLAVGGCAAPALEAPAMPARPFAFAEESALIDFAYSYPAAAAAIPALNAHLQTDFAAVQADAVAWAESDRASAPEVGRPYHRHFMHKTWTNAGQSERMLSLVAHIETFTGGAHGNTGFATLLWDRAAQAPVGVLQLFGDPSALVRLMGRDYCEALDQERLKRRDGERLQGEFGRCPAFGELSIAPADSDADGRFDTIRFLAGPYVAGPYVEGEYEIALPVTSAELAALQPEYRASFEAQSGQ